MSTFLRKIAGAFVELPAEPEVQPAQTAATPIRPQVPTTPVGTGVPVAQYVTPAVDEEMVNSLIAVSMKRQTSYTAFIEASKKLEAIIPDENQRVKAAFVTVSGEGRSLDQMLQAIDVHVSDVESEKGRFMQASDQSKKTQVDSVHNQANSLIKANDEITRQIASYQDQIATLTTKAQDNASAAATLQQQANEAEVKIQQVKDNFFRAAEYVQHSLTDRKNMLAALITK